MKIFLINLDRHPDRLAHMREELAGLEFERVRAVDGAESQPTASGLSRFELACLASHQVAWRRFLLGSDESACFLEDDLHVRPGLAPLAGDRSWVPGDAHCVKLDTYLQKVRLGARLSAPDGRQIAPLYTRHQSSAAYMLTRQGAVRYLELTARPALPADYSLFPRNPRRAGLRIYQLVPAIAIQDHLLRSEDGRRSFATAITEPAPTSVSRGSPLGKLAREAARFMRQAAELRELVYEKAFLRAETTTVSVR